MAEKEFEFDNLAIADSKAPAVLDLSINRPFIPKSEEENQQKVLEEIAELLRRLEKQQTCCYQNLLEKLGKIPLDMTVELGQVEIEGNNFESIENQTIGEIDKEVNICINGSPIAKGKLVIKDEKIGILLTEIIEIKE